MPALDSGSILIEYGNIFVGDDAGSVVDCGAVRDVKFMGDPQRTRVLSDNRGEIINKIRLQGVFEATLLEPANMSILENIFKGLVTKASVAGSLVSGATVVKTSGQWLWNQPILLTGQNGDGTAPTITSVVSSTNGALVLNVDYVLVKNPTDNRYYILIIDSTTVTTQSQTITITYSYTPSASLTLTGGTNQTATVRYIKIEGPSEDDSNVKRTITIASAICSSPLLLEFVDVENGGDVGKMPVKFEGLKGEVWTITDAINPT